MDVDADTKREDDERGPSKPRGERDRRDSVREREKDRERDRDRRDRSRASSPARRRAEMLTDLPLARRRGDHWDGEDRRNDVRLFSPFFFPCDIALNLSFLVLAAALATSTGQIEDPLPFSLSQTLPLAGEATQGGRRGPFALALTRARWRWWGQQQTRRGLLPLARRTNERRPRRGRRVCEAEQAREQGLCRQPQL
jgi:hypothetical protein